MPSHDYKVMVNAIRKAFIKIIRNGFYPEILIDNPMQGQIFLLSSVYTTETKHHIGEVFIERPILSFQYVGDWKNENLDINMFYQIDDHLFEELCVLAKMGEMNSLLPSLKMGLTLPALVDHNYNIISTSFFLSLKSKISRSDNLGASLLDECIAVIGLDDQTGERIEVSCMLNERKEVRIPRGDFFDKAMVPFDKVSYFKGVESKKEMKQNSKRSASKINILFLAANPTDTGRLQLDEEARAIQEKIRQTGHRESMDFVSRWATRSSDILQAINETNPTIVHFSGHGAETGELILQKPDGNMEHVTKEAISAAMATGSDTIRLIVFNTCFSHLQAKDTVMNIQATIGMSESISDNAARVFAAQLYSSIGFGHSLKKAFDQAIVALKLESTLEDEKPVLYTRDHINPNDIVFIRP